ncbi:MAG: methylated-DNA--[protein]-cysteine S-methyltransferase [Nitrospirota bacterium]
MKKSTIAYRVFGYNSPIGPLYCVFENTVLIELAINEKPVFISELPESVPTLNNSFKAELDAYFKGELKEFAQKVKFASGTPFEQRIWRMLRKVPYGETRSYKWIAGRVGSPGAMRAVGQALGKNPLPIIVPCHRIIAADGSIGGFSSGVEAKRWLLEHEKTNKE